jgi:hypothetical protein
MITRIHAGGHVGGIGPMTSLPHSRLQRPISGQTLLDKISQPSVTFSGSRPLDKVKQDVLESINKPVLNPQHMEAWLSQFAPRDRRTALRLVQAIDYHTYPDMVNNVKQMHHQVASALVKDGFIQNPAEVNPFEKYKNVDFTRIYTAKSGDLISVMYRKANKLPGTLFKTTEALSADSAPKNDRALVILDDYAGTGVQFLFEFYAHNNRELLNQYGKIYFVLVSAHDKALDKFAKLKAGNHAEVSETIIQEFHIKPPEFQARVREAMKEVSGDRLQLITLNQEIPLLSPENPKLTPQEKVKMARFLQKYNVYKYPFGVGEAQGNTAFFYSAPNTLPDLLWNTKSTRKDGSPWLPLFHRTEDISIYHISNYVDPTKQVW